MVKVTGPVTDSPDGWYTTDQVEPPAGFRGRGVVSAPLRVALTAVTPTASVAVTVTVAVDPLCSEQV